MSKGHRIGYIRVSTLDQNTERQLDGIELDRTFTDKASGKDANRPQLLAALQYVRGGDTFIVHSMDRLARNTEDLLRTVRELNERGVVVTFVKENLTFNGKHDAMAELMMTVLAGIAKFERALILERQREGIAIAKARGVYKGRKRALNAEQAAELVECARSGMPKAELARSYGISRETLYQYLRVGREVRA
ncbi:MAG TPA: recombinase family protein [Casimicrobiaceae bacterium]|nr:recombinase family protein [Casimicrobiaceae bacterium]